MSELNYDGSSGPNINAEASLCGKVPQDIEKCQPDHAASDEKSLQVDASYPIVADTDTTTYPDGGLRAWSVVLGGMSTFCSYGYICAFGVYQDYYTRVYMTAHSASTISWIGAVDSFLTISTGLVVGRLFDRGYCLHLLYGGSLLEALSLFMLSFVKPNQFYGAFLCQGIGVGLGGGMTYVPSLAILSHYFEKKRSLAMSVATAGVSLGSMIIPILVNNLFARPNLDFATVTRITAAFMTAIMFLACVLLKPRLPPPKTHANLKNCLKRFSKDWAYIALTAGYTFFALGFFFPIFYLQLAAITHGLSENLAFYSLVILNGSGFVARLLTGLISQWAGVDNLAIIAAIVCGSVTFAFVSIGSVASVIIVAILYGFFSGVYIGTMAPLGTLLTDNMAELGLRLGVAFAVSGLGELAGPPIMGALLTGKYLWWRPAVTSGLIVLAAGASFIVVKVIIRHRTKLASGR
ncbi:hypothetical protein Agabi119p4_2125 [Agaricus bisporus var. burnettii]|uniref:Major facilitator superfamily (MFS) profile domain-containing protein n=1 Tax=Agaricus bisporus var. burnettii TaxID=192524 RepID=A0A8H7F8K0_AGABI|nr:hypothetical protein Agabi119p4_2125 [Agaricus bisporus var. burnettii]